jgi:hypothetical protein
VPIILDTNVVRSIGAGNMCADVLAHAATDGLTLHLSETAASELAHALLAGRMPWEHWVTARDKLDRVLDDAEPILLGGSHAMARAGFSGSHASPESIADALRGYTAGWRLLSQAKSMQDLARAEVAEDGTSYKFAPGAVRQVVAQEKVAWIAEFDDFVASATGQVPGIITELMTSRGRQELLRIFVARLAEGADRVSPGMSPSASTRLDGFLRVHALLHLRALSPKEPYNPTKDANDAFDHMLLRSLALPAAVCTNDNGIHADLLATGSWQQAWVVRTEDLSEASVLQRLRRLEWPAHPNARE